MKYYIPVTYQSYGLVPIEAKDKADVIKKLSSKDFIDNMPLPDEPEYIEDSFRIDTDGGTVFNGYTENGKKETIVLTDEETSKLENVGS